MLKAKRKEIITFLLLTMCTSLLQTTLALSAEKDNERSILINSAQVTDSKAGTTEENTIIEAADNKLVNSSANSESDFTYEVDSGTIIITGYTGSATDVIIPSQINGTRVGALGYGAFANCNNIKNVTIPDTVTSTGYNVFKNCTNLQSVNIPPHMTYIADYSFYGCSNLSSITIPNSITSISKSAFYGCSKLTSITIPDSVGSIGDSAFYGCSNLINVSLPNNIPTIADSVFYGCSNLTGITIPSSVRSIGNYAFYRCSALKNISLPDNVKNIGYEAFENCSSLISVNIPKGLTLINSQLFQNCTSLTSITVPDNITEIDSQAFYGCSNLQNITIPNSVKTIHNTAFGECTNLTSIILPNNLANISEQMFEQCSNLTSITIPDSVTTVGRFAFYGCSNLKSITIPSHVTSIDENAFKECSSLSSITIPASVTSIKSNAFNNCEKALFYVENEQIKNLLISALVDESKIIVTGKSDFGFDSNTGTITTYNGSDTQLIMPSTINGVPVTNIGKSSFKNLSNITSIIIQGNVISIGDSAFQGCSKLSSIVIPNSITSIGDSAFWGCNNLTSITIPDSVKSIGNYAFVDCNSTLFYVLSEKTKELLESAGVDESKIVIKEPPTVKVTSVLLNTNALNWTVGKTGTFTATVAPSNASNKSVTWKSSNTKVATVDANGKLTAVGAGSATITCTASDGSGKYATCVVTVTNPLTKVTSVTLNTTNLNWTVGKTGTFTVTVAPSNASNKGVTWKSSNTKVATVDANGKLTAVGAGSATITCTASDGSGKYATCVVTVTNPLTKVTSVTLNTTNLNWTVGKTGTFTATVAPSNASNKSVTWKSSNTKVATVDANGKLTAVGAGSATITCTASDGSGKYATCVVTVTKPATVKVTSVKLNTNKLNWTVGKTGTFTATVLPSNASNKGVTWKSSNTKVATVDANGKLTAVGAGSATITCTASDGSGKYATCVVTVTKPATVKVTSVKLNTNKLNWTVGKTGTFIATVLPSNASNKNVIWKSSNTKVATVSSNGKLTAVGAGSATITCTASDGSGKYATCVVTVKK
ncbi:Ig domain protein group 2 domain protein [Clostridium sp. DL-VIII]|uniref:leucine-rich repeat protein n=1 Tax=Clostridium sp. DL-VIII TaxID=641107 RepID=UPI00023B0725|nr:leucine-rich repeat protein [Clostridium sp. DL-VIII]EHJ02118.1 Ig domain protein group 2 domain protein [Clostridium sp. DL-VIII]